MFWFVCFVGSLPCIDPESSKEVPQEIAQRVGRVGGLFAAIICLCSSGLSEHPWDSQTTLLALFQNKGRILERYTEFRGYLCGRLDGLLFLGNPGRILGEVRRASRLAVCGAWADGGSAFVRRAYLSDMCLSDTLCPKMVVGRAKGLLTPLR